MKYLSLILTTCLVFFVFPKFSYSATTSNKVIYKINKPYDQDGISLSSTKIYVDDQYTHHEDDEIIYFCDGCFCDNDKNIPCGLGQHLIKIIKTGYVDWLDQRNIILGESYETSPILIKITSTATPSPTTSSTPIETSTPTQTATPAPPKATYKINKTKDQDGQSLSSVKIYIDNQYTHHLDDETLEFCDGCFCDSDKSISCGFGEHTIKLAKSGYSDWSEQRNFTQGANFEISPIFTKIISETTSTPTATHTPSPTPTATPTKTPTPSPSAIIISTSSATMSMVLGESTDSATISADYSMYSEATSTPKQKYLRPTNYKTPFFIGLFVSVSSGALLYFRHRKD